MTVSDEGFAKVLGAVEGDARALMAAYPDARSALIPMAHRFQQEEGWLSPSAIAQIAHWLGLTVAEVESTVSFYTLFYRRPVGRYMIQPCRNLTCLIVGAEETNAHFREKLGIGHLQTTADGLFSYEEAECLAACDRAPCAQVNLEFVYDLTNEKIDEMIAQMRAGTYVVPPRPQTAAAGTDWQVAAVTSRKSAGAQDVVSPNDPGGMGDASGASMLARLVNDPAPVDVRPTEERLVREGPAIISRSNGSADKH